MSTIKETDCSKDGDSKEARDSNLAPSPSSRSPALPCVPQSPTCRRIFFDDNFKVAPFPEVTEDVMEQQKLKWNFDFQTETPLQGRYLWVRTQKSSGYYKNGKNPPQLAQPPLDRKKTSKRSRRSEDSNLQPTEEKEGTKSGGSCDTALNDPPESRKSLRLSQSPLRVDWT